MPGQLVSLRLLSTSSGLLASRRGVSILYRAFPFKLKYATLCPGPPPRSRGWLTAAAAGGRAFSSRSALSRGGGQRDSRRGALRGGSASAGKERSLVEDEAELSDWISDLKTDSFRFAGSESDDTVGYSREKGRSKESGIGGGRERVRDRRDSFRGGFSVESDEDGDYSGGKRSSRERISGRDVDTFGDRRKRGREPRRSGRGFTVPSMDEPDKMSLNRSTDGPFRGSRDRRLKGFDSDLTEDEEDDMDFGGRKRERRGARSTLSSSASSKRGKKESGLSLSRNHDGRMSFEISDDEDNVDSYEDDDTVSGSDDDHFGKADDKKEAVASHSHGKEGSPHNPGNDSSKSSTSGGADSYLSETRFDQCSLSPLSLKGIKAAGYERMTVVQEATLPVILQGKDVLAKAKTGTGKTVAFLLPAIEEITKLPSVDRDQKRPPIVVLVICPTRELANQAATEANTLLKFHPSIGVQVVIGGTRLALEQRNMQANPCQILVATPGRLRDHIENTSGFATRLRGVKVLVLDEADHLLDMGFRKDIENIIAAVPKQRQTLLFSATVPDEVRQICHVALKRDFEFINTVEEGSEETHSQVNQMLLVAPLEEHFSMLYGILTNHIADNVDYKVLVFCTTAMVTKLVADFLSELKLNVREIHSRKPQSYRTRVSDEFRKSKGLILVTSDVSARGVDYPDVTLVVQVGVPADREQYIHRLGRTGRKGKQGEGILLLAPWEEFFLQSIKDLPISKAPVPILDPETRKKVVRALSHVEMKNKESAYQSWLGYYNSNKNIGREKGRLVALANEFSRSMGLDDPPAISKLVLGKMGLRNVPGLRTK